MIIVYETIEEVYGEEWKKELMKISFKDLETIFNNLSPNKKELKKDFIERIRNKLINE